LIDLSLSTDRAPIAELADRENPHPEGWPLHEYTWKTIFLHSLVGWEQGLESNIFGLTEQEALFQTAFPGLTPPQINEGLKEIKNSAFYLRLNQGRYYASLDPSVNIALAKIRRSLEVEQIDDLLYCRQVTCPNCGGEAPLLNTCWLSKEAEKQWGVKIITDGKSKNGTVRFETYRVSGGKGPAGEDPNFATVNRAIGQCIHCKQAIDADEI
jgi:hypothetical protein